MTLTGSGGVVLLTLALVCPSSAQDLKQVSPAGATQVPSTETEEIRRRVRVEQKVLITDDEGRQVEGRISTLGLDRLTLVSRRGSTDIAYHRIVRVDRPRDGLGDGALWGLGAGAAVGLLAVLQEEECDPAAFFCGDPGAAAYVVVPLITGGLGAAIGVGVDALIRRDPNIYRRGNGTARLLVRPAFDQGIKGAVVSVSWCLPWWRGGSVTVVVRGAQDRSIPALQERAMTRHAVSKGCDSQSKATVW